MQGDAGQESAVDRVMGLRALMTSILKPPSLRVPPACATRRVGRRTGRPPGRTAGLPPPTDSADQLAKVPPPLRPVYAVIEAGFRELPITLQTSSGPITQEASFRQ